MGKKNLLGMILALVMVVSLCLDSYAIYARDLGASPEPAIEDQVDKEEPGKDEKIEKPEKVVEEKGKENPVSSEEVDKKLIKEEKEVQKEEAKEAIELGEEKVPDSVGAPEGFDVTTINTIAKGNDGNYYGVKTYGNSYGDTDIFKTYYRITEDQYNQVAKDCFMIFKRADGQAFKLQGVKISTSYIDGENLKDGVTAGPIFTEIQFKHHMAYRLGFLVNNSPLKVDGQEELTWSITLKKDWVIERCPDFSDNSSPDYAYVNYNVEIDGGGHKIYRNDDGVTGILQLGSGLSGQNVPVRTAKIKNLTIEGNNKYYGIELSQKGILYLENVKIENCYAGKNNYYYGGAIKLNDGAQLTMDANTSISNCKANLGGAIRLLDNCSLTINGSTFTNNQADLGGAICALKDNCKININNAGFNGNKAVNTIIDEYLQGGAIYTNSPLNISGTTFKDNFANKNGGAIASFADVEINGGTFSDNFAGKYGGAVYSSANKLDIKGTTFENNGKFETEQGKYITSQGGAVYANTKLTIDGAKFEENISNYGGAIISYEDATIKKSNFIDNTAHNGGALYIFKSAKAKITDTKFTKNIAFGEGGAIFTNSHQYQDPITEENAYKNLNTAADTVFKDNLALSGFFDPPANYKDYTDLKFARNSFTEKLPDQDIAKSLLNNYDVNYKNAKLSAFFDPNGGEFKDGANSKDIKVIKKDKGTEITILEAPKREGYKFLGWKGTVLIPENKLKDFDKETLETLKEGKIYKPGDKFKLDSNYIFIAQWEKEDKPTPKPDNKPTPRGSIFFVGPAPLLNKEDHAQYLIGYQDRTFGAENKMTREEVAVMFSRLLKNPPRKGQVYPYNFSDVARDRWSITAISYMNQLGIIKGYPDGSFKPEASITRAEFATMAARFADLKEGTKTFTDLDKNYWAYDLVQRAASAGWITGYPDGTFKPDKNITRAEVVAITNRMLDRKADQEFVDQNLGKILHFTDLDKSYWAYYPILEATNGHDYIRHENKLDEYWKEVTGKTFVYDK